ncbi:MAG: PIN domain-containing protein [Actinomycetota bacterium]
MALVIDTGVLLAALRADDPEHDRCVALIATCREPRVVPAPVLVELDYWLRKFGANSAWLGFCEDVAERAYSVHHLDPDGLVRAAMLQKRYANLSLNFVDAAVFTTCETLGETKVATLDHRDFGTLRTSDGRSLAVLPS